MSSCCLSFCDFYFVTDIENMLEPLNRKDGNSSLDKESTPCRASSKTSTAVKNVREHVFFGMHKNKTSSPQDEFNKLRELRTDDL